ncbi:hypothetical protein Tco_1112035 [Tanacetum coccineum]|uniref:ARID DNA-binding domain-containing protein n=1 Tax=Tanacetum coccineum TaxID=301880 RepID=A0ABQ5IQI7_9ASTR
MKNKEHDEGTEKPGNISETAKLVNEEFMTTKPTVSLKYPEWIHFATKCMIKGTDQGHWDDIWYISSNTNMHLCSKLNLFCNIKESFAVSKLDDQMKFLFTYGIGEVVVKNGDEREFGKIGEILGLSIQDKEEVKRCYINFLDVFTCYYKTARVPKQEHNPVLNMPTEIVEEDK